MSEQEPKAEFITHLLKGNNAVIKGDYDGAIAEYGIALEINPKFFLAASKLGDAYLKKGEPRKAVRFLTYSLELNPEQPRIMFKLGQAYEELGMSVQATVAYEMAKEKGTEKEYMASSSPEGGRRRRARQSLSGRALGEVSGTEILGGSISTLMRYPLLLFPFIVAALLLSAGEMAIDKAFVMISGNPAVPTSIAKILLTGNYKYDPSVLIHYLALGTIISILCAPVLSSAIVVINDVYRGRTPSLSSGFSRSFKMLSPIIGFSMLFFIVLASAALLSGILVASLNSMVVETTGFGGTIFPLSSLAIPFAASYFIYTIHSIVLEKRQMEKGFEKGFRVGKRFAGLTFMILMLYTAAHMAISYFIFGNVETIGFIKTKYIVLLAVSPFQALAAIAVTLVFLKSQQVKRKRRKPGEPGRPSPEDDFDEPENYDDADEYDD